MDESESPQTGRSKRQKFDKHGRLSALAKLKQLKGSKHKYEVDELDSVYEEVDEREYCRKVEERQEDDWIVDDDGSGYVEDGREIFDDDLDSESVERASNSKESGPRKKADPKKKKGNIRNILLGMSSKKENKTKLDDDNILDDLMAELKDDSEEKTERPKYVNKFAVTPKSSSLASKIKSKPASFVRTTEEDEPVVSLVKAVETTDEIRDDEMIFDRPKKESAKARNSSEKSSTVSEFLGTGGKNQKAEKDETFPDERSPEKRQMIQIEEDLFDFDEDLTSVTFEDSNHAFPSLIEPDETKTVVPNDTELPAEEADICNELWDDDFGEQFTDIEVSVNTENLPLIANAKGEKTFRFYWWDAFEDPWKQPGVIYLFGKVYVESAKSFVSCCVTVKNLDRQIFLLPKEHIRSEDGAKKPVTMTDVYNEFNDYANTLGITTFRSQKVTKNYAFEMQDVPQMSEYLEVRYSAKLPKVQANYDFNTIKRVFGVTSQPLELFLIQNKVKGPCWLEVKSPLPVGNPVSWCKIEIECHKLTNIAVFYESQNTPPPPLVTATLNIRVGFNPKVQENEISMAAVLLHHNYRVDKPAPKPPFTKHFCLVTKPDCVSWPLHSREELSKNTQTEVVFCDKERALLEQLLERIDKSDPDLIIGYDAGFQLDVLMQRMFDLSVSNWSRMGKLRRSAAPVYKGRVMIQQVLSGRLLCDIQVAAKELNLKVRSYDLPSLCANVLKKKEGSVKELKPQDVVKFYARIEKINELVQITMMEASYIVIIMLELNVIPLALQITCIAGNILSRTLTAGRAERNEYLLLHAFHERGYIAPDKRSTKQEKFKTDKNETKPGKKKPAYAGGLVLDPKVGFYDTLILLMDFNSLYPSIIQEYNLCFTTVPGAAYTEDIELNLPEADLEPGVIPTEIRKLVESRRDVKSLMKASNISPELRMQYNTRQMALKLTANSMYGCLGATHSRFYAKGLAALVTAKGRDILTSTRDLVERMNYQVIYGDTDSIMINTNVLNYDEVYGIGRKIKQEVNKLYKKVELDIDGVFKYLLLLKKKKYAAVTINKLPNGQLETVQELKGLDIVRRDWSQLSCDTGRYILDQLFTDQPLDSRLENIFECLQKVAQNLRDGKVPLASLVITKQLSKSPREYPNQKQPHVSVAVRLNEKGGRTWKAGDIVPYVICEDGTENSATDRAYHVDELKNSETLKIDVNYYLMCQVLPVVMRICDPIPGIDDMLLSEHLGLQDIYKPKTTYHNEDEPLELMDDEQYKYCSPLKFSCPNEKCGQEITIEAPFAKTTSGMVAVLSKCPNSACNAAPWHYLPMIRNKLHLVIREAINEYYKGNMECEDPACDNRTRQLPQEFFEIYPVCDLCQKCVMFRSYTEAQLYNQIDFYLYMFNLDHPNYKQYVAQLPTEVKNAYDTLKEFVEKKLRSSAYSVINLSELFSYYNPKWSKHEVKVEVKREPMDD